MAVLNQGVFMTRPPKAEPLSEAVKAYANRFGVYARSSIETSFEQFNDWQQKISSAIENICHERAKPPSCT